MHENPNSSSVFTACGDPLPVCYIDDQKNYGEGVAHNTLILKEE